MSATYHMVYQMEAEQETKKDAERIAKQMMGRLIRLHDEWEEIEDLQSPRYEEIREERDALQDELMNHCGTHRLDVLFDQWLNSSF